MEWIGPADLLRNGNPMTDSRLRTLARDALTDPSLMPRLLRERIRAGDLLEERARLAAYLGDEGAREVVGALPEWCLTMDAYDLHQFLAAIPTLSTWETGRTTECPIAHPDGSATVIYSTGFAQWPIACPTCNGTGTVPETAEREVMVRAAIAAAAGPGWECLEVIAETELELSIASNVLSFAAQWVDTQERDHYDGWCQEWDRLIGTASVAHPPHPDSDMADYIQAVARATSEQAVRDAIRDALVPWLLE